MSAQLHVVDKEARLQQVRGDGLDINGLLSDAYKQAAGDETQRRLSAVRRAVKMIGMGATLRLSAAAASSTLTEAVPFWPKTWKQVSFSNGETVLDEEKPYRVLGVQKSVMGEPLSYTYDPTSHLLYTTGDDDGYAGEAWIAEMRLESPYVKNNAAQFHDIKFDQFAPQYPPPHLAYVTEVMEVALQKGAVPRWPAWLGQAMLGVPFAYEGGVIKTYDRENGLAYAKIVTDDGTETRSFLPLDESLVAAYSTVEEDVSAMGGIPLKAEGTTVEQYEPLCNTSANLSTPDGSSRVMGTPIEANGTFPSQNVINFSSDPGVVKGDIISLRVVNQDFDRALEVESGGVDVKVRGEVPPVDNNDWVYVVPTASGATGAQNWTVTLDTPYSSGTSERIVRRELRRVFPPNAPVAIDILTP